MKNSSILRRALGAVALTASLAGTAGDVAEREYIPLCNPNHIWVYTYPDSRCGYENNYVFKRFVRFSFDGKTEINGKEYLNLYVDMRSVAGTDVRHSLVGYMREANRQVFFIDSGLPFEGNICTGEKIVRPGDQRGECMLYDFTTSPGEYSFILVNRGDIERIVEETMMYWDGRGGERILYETEKEIFGVKRKVRYLGSCERFNQPISYAGYKVIEGIGVVGPAVSNGGCGCSLIMPGYVFTPYYRAGEKLLYCLDKAHGNALIYKDDEVPENPEDYFRTVGIEDMTATGDVVGSEYYDLTGALVDTPGHGVYVRVDRMADGRTRTSKVILR